MQIEPPVPSLKRFSRGTVTVSPPHLLGKTLVGERRVVPILSGTFEGRLSAEVVPGGADWQFVSQDGTNYLEARYLLKTPEGVLILVRNRGIRHASPDILAQLYSGTIVDPAKYYFRSTPTFETGDDRYAWLNRIVAVCSGARTADSVLLDFYEVL